MAINMSFIPPYDPNAEVGMARSVTYAMPSTLDGYHWRELEVGVWVLVNPDDKIVAEVARGTPVGTFRLGSDRYVSFEAARRAAEEIESEKTGAATK